MIDEINRYCLKPIDVIKIKYKNYKKYYEKIERKKLK